MNNEELTNPLEHLDLPEVELPTHRRHLKMALLNSGLIQQKATMTSPFSFRVLAPIGAIAFALVIVFGVSYLNGTPHTYAAELAQKSLHAISQLSDAQKNALDTHLHSEADSLLSQAVNAKDLKVLSPDKVTGLMYPSSWMDTLSQDERASFEARLAGADLKGAQFLQFTNDSGEKVILAINQGNLPVYQIQDIGTKDADEAAGVRTLVENFGQQLKNLSLLSSTAAQDIRTHYQEYVAPALLSAWEANPAHALGRVTSSPWPESIVVTDLQKTDANTYTVKGDILEVTSAEITQNAANAEPVTFTVSNMNGRWLITEASVQTK